MRFVPGGWPGLKSPWLRPMILCGQHSLEIFCLGVFLAFAGYFVLTEIDGGLALHFLVAFIGIVDHVRRGVAELPGTSAPTPMSAARIRATGGNADIVGAG